MKLFIATVVFMVWASAVTAQEERYKFIDALDTYSEWATRKDWRYMEHLFVAVISKARTPSDGRLRVHWSTCIGQRKMTMRQISDGVRGFGELRSELHGLPVVISLLRYLDDLCGPLPN